MDKRDIDKTMVFKPIQEEKPILRREEAPLYNDTFEEGIIEEYREKEKSNKMLIYSLLIFSIILVIGITVTIVLLSDSGAKKNGGELQNSEVENVVVREEDEEYEEEEEVIPKEERFWYASFYSSSVEKTDEGYSVYAKLYDNEMMVDGSETLYITNKTDITVNGKRLRADAFMYMIEKSEGEIVFETEIDREESLVLSVSFDGEIKLSEDEEEPQEDEENQSSEETEENQGEETSEEEGGNQGAIVE